MGVKYDGGQVFEPVARKLLDYNAPDYVITDVCAVLIEQLQGLYWETEAASLAEFNQHPAVVEAFARREVYLARDPRNPDFDDYRKDHLESYPDPAACPYGGSCAFHYPPKPR